jgi:mono/diheme cytochrome c family protein
MLTPVKLGLAVTVALLASGASVLMSQQKPARPDANTSAIELSGKEMFRSYCASCHGEDAKGHGPAAQALKIAPPDLTSLAKQNKGKFPTEYVNTVIVHGADTPAHGSADMPVWGPVFVGLNDHRMVIVHVSRLSEYLETLQAK